MTEKVASVSSCWPPLFWKLGEIFEIQEDQKIRGHGRGQHDLRSPFQYEIGEIV